MTITSSGISSGIDTKSLIEQLVQVQKMPISNLQSKKSDIQVQISKIGDISSKLSSLKSVLDDMGTLSDILAYAGTASDTDILAITANGSAAAGSYSVNVTNLAVAEKDLSSGFASGASEVKAGTISISTNGDAAVDVAINDGDTLADVAASINGADAGVFASLVNDGSQSYLQLTSKETGYTIGGVANDAISITESYTGSTGAELALAQTVTAENATFTLDTIAVTQKTNHVTDVLPGVTLDLKTEGSTTFEIAPDTSAIKDKLQGFVDSYNAVVNLLQKELKVTEGTNRARSLVSDPNIRRIRQDLSSIVSGSVGNTGGTYSALSEIGIRTSANGTLSIDSADLDTAFNSDLASVAKIFTLDTNGISDAIGNVADSYTNSVDGAFANRTKSLNSVVKRLDADINTLTSRADSYEARLSKQFLAMETAIARIQSQGNQLSAFLSGLN